MGVGFKAVAECQFVVEAPSKTGLKSLPCQWETGIVSYFWADFYGFVIETLIAGNAQGHGLTHFCGSRYGLGLNFRFTPLGLSLGWGWFQTERLFHPDHLVRLHRPLSLIRGSPSEC